MLVGDGQRFLACVGRTCGEGDDGSTIWRQTHFPAQAEDGVENGADRPGQFLRSRLQRRGVGRGATPTDEAGAVRFKSRRSGVASIKRNDMHSPDGPLLV